MFARRPARPDYPWGCRETRGDGRKYGMVYGAAEPTLYRPGREVEVVRVLLLLPDMDGGGDQHGTHPSFSEICIVISVSCLRNITESAKSL